MKPLVWTLTLISLTVSAAFGVSTQYFQDSTSTDFKAGKSDNVVISNSGKISLGVSTVKLLESRTDVSTVFEVRVGPDGKMLAATGPEGRLLVRGDNKTWDTLYKSDQPYLFCMDITRDGKILVGTGGSAGNVIELSADGKNSKSLFTNKDVQYVWKIKQLPNGKILVATGPNGKLFLIEKSEATEIFKCKQKNIQALALGKNGAVYVGTDGEGIVYKIEPQGDKYVGRAVYDAKESEISALAVDAEGNVYAATASETAGSQQAQSYLTKSAGTPTTASAPATMSAPALPNLDNVTPTPTATPTATPTPANPKPANSASGAKTTKRTMTPAMMKARMAYPKQRATVKKNQKPSATAKEPSPMRPRRPQGPDMLPSPPVMPLGGMPTGSSPAGKGNAVYRIDQLGFVTEVFRDEVNITSMIERNGKIYLGTGPDGYVFVVNPATEEVTLYAKTSASYANAIVLLSDQSLLLGTGTPGQVVRLGPDLAKTGTFTSKVFDATQMARWGVVDVIIDPSTSAGKLSLSTRTSVLANPDDPGWSEWSKPVLVVKDQPIPITSPLARFIQYRLTFEPAGDTALTVKKVQLAYMQDNHRPQVTAVSVITGQPDKPAGAEGGEGGENPGEGGGPAPMMGKVAGPRPYRFMWKASDSNSDALRYFIYLRRVGTPYWILLEKDMVQPMMMWDQKSVPDGRYELKVVASDELANPAGMGQTAARMSDPFTVDNTAPVVKNLNCKILGPGKVLLQADLVDEISDISSAWVCINAGKEWQYLASADELYDSKQEHVETILNVKTDIEPIMITIKVSDTVGNIGYGWQLVPQGLQTKNAVDGAE